MNIVVLMAGASTNFAEKGYMYPKYLLDYKGKPIVQHVVDSLKPLNANLSFVILKEDDDKAFIASTLQILAPNANIYKVNKLTKGAVCSALFAIDSINNNEELLLINGDQLLTSGLVESIEVFRQKQYEGGIIVFRSVLPRWSFVALDEKGLVCETSEKRPISDLATAGCYWFKHGKDFVEAAYNIIRKDENFSGNYYICSTYNELILRQQKVGVYEIPMENYLSFATPQLYEENKRK